MHRMNDGDVDQPDGEPRGRIKVLLADSHQLLGQALATALQADADLVLVGSARTWPPLISAGRGRTCSWWATP